MVKLLYIKIGKIVFCVLTKFRLIKNKRKPDKYLIKEFCNSKKKFYFCNLKTRVVEAITSMLIFN